MSKVAYLSCLFSLFILSPGTKSMNEPKGNGIAVVELFTSEGCSSCPDADNNITRLLEKQMDNVFILSFHVDYWNRLGWKDVYSDAAFSMRQRNYARVFGLQSVYTPQVVVNGSTEFVGSDENKLDKVVESNLSKTLQPALEISAEKNGNKITVRYKTGTSNNWLLNLALVEPEATSKVRAGENGGRILHHVNIVRSLKTIDNELNESATMEIPAGLDKRHLKLIAYTQDKHTLQVFAAAQQTIQ